PFVVGQDGAERAVRSDDRGAQIMRDTCGRGAFANHRDAEPQGEGFNRRAIPGREVPEPWIRADLFRMRGEDGRRIKVRIETDRQQRGTIAKLCILEDDGLGVFELSVHPWTEVRERTARVYERDGHHSTSPVRKGSRFAAFVDQVYVRYMLSRCKRIEGRQWRGCHRFMPGAFD